MGDLVPHPDPTARVLTGLVCQGLQPDGEICGAVFTGRPRWGDVLEQARSAGWKVGYRKDGTPDAMCPRCGG